MTIAVDFNDTIMDSSNVAPGYKMGRPFANAVEVLKAYHSKGGKIIISTNMAHEFMAKKMVKQWLDFFKIPYDEITNIKPKADYYIDDKAIEFKDNWSEIGRRING